MESDKNISIYVALPGLCMPEVHFFVCFAVLCGIPILGSLGT